MTPGHGEGRACQPRLWNLLGLQNHPHDTEDLLPPFQGRRTACATPRWARTMRRHRLCTSSWVGPRRAPRPGQLRARRAACGPHRPRGPGHLKLLCRLPSRPVFPWPSEGSSKTSGLLRAHPASRRLAPRGQAGSPQRPRALAKLPLPGAVSAFWCPARCPLPSQGPVTGPESLAARHALSTSRPLSLAAPP